MKIAKILALPFIASMVASAAYGQIYSQNIVGYYNQTIYAGNNYIANQLSTSNNTLDAIFQTGVVPEDATFTEWNPTTSQFLPTSTYDVNTGWSINYTLTYGEGGLLNTPTTFNNAFIGSVWPEFNPPNAFTPPLVADSGTLFLSCVIPITNADFYAVIGRAPQNGESVTLLDAATQTSVTTAFEDGSWNNGDPVLNIGESAFYNLESVAPAPEPAVYGLLGVGAVLLIAMRRFFETAAQVKN